MKLRTLLITSLVVPVLALFISSCGGNGPEDLTTPEGIAAALAADSTNPEALHARAKLYITKNRPDSALMDMRKAILRDSSVSAYFVTLGDAYLMVNQTRYTRQALERAIRLQKDNKDAHMKLAELFLYVEMRQEAINEINEVLKLERTNPKAYYLKGMIYKESGDTSLAVSSFMTTIEQDPKNVLAFEQIGLIYASAGNPRAVDYYQGALRLDPKNSLTRYNLGMFYQESGQIDKAVETYQELVSLDKSFANGFYNLGFIYFEYQKDAAKALPLFEQAASANGNYPAAIYMQGICKEKLGKKMEAVDAFNKTLSLDPRFEPAKEGLARLGVKS
jgi:tetratricopeptide (TPR) repeat protein